MKISTTLQKARDLIEKGWNKYQFALDKHGAMVLFDSKRAVSFCARGALARIEDFDGPAEIFMQEFSGEHCLGWWNNNCDSKEEVLMGFDLAILAAKAAGK